MATLFTTKAKYIALSTALRDVIYYIMLLRNELLSFGIAISMQVPTAPSKVF
jgi:hypothetical protein